MSFYFFEKRLNRALSASEFHMNGGTELQSGYSTFSHFGHDVLARRSRRTHYKKMYFKFISNCQKNWYKNFGCISGYLMLSIISLAKETFFVACVIKTKTFLIKTHFGPPKNILCTQITKNISFSQKYMCEYRMCICSTEIFCYKFFDTLKCHFYTVAGASIYTYKAKWISHLPQQSC